MILEVRIVVVFWGGGSDGCAMRKTWGAVMFDFIKVVCT